MANTHLACGEQLHAVYLARISCPVLHLQTIICKEPVEVVSEGRHVVVAVYRLVSLTLGVDTDQRFTLGLRHVFTTLQSQYRRLSFALK